MSAIDVRALTFRFSDGTPALDGVSFAIEAGSRVGLVGPNGAGKSTLLLHIAGVFPDPDTGTTTGEVLLDGARIDDVSRRHVGLLFQDPDDQLFCATVGEDVAFAPKQLGMPPNVEAALAKVGLGPEFAPRPPHRLSGGEKKRVALAGLLSYAPRILVFDEPTSGLDPRGRRQLIEIVKGLDATGIFATHDLALVEEVCARTIVIDGGKVVADGATKEILANGALMDAHGLR